MFVILWGSLCVIHFYYHSKYLNELQREPLRLWYRISPSMTAIKEEEPIQRKTTTPPTEEVKTKGQGNNQRASLVDITSKRSWQCNGKDERKTKHRKRSSAEKTNEKIQRTTPPLPETSSVDSLLVVPVAKTIFDEARTPEFSCSTPIPSTGSVAPPSETTESGESNKIHNWLPKAVFDLDDRALFAKRLQRITNPSEFRPEEVTKEDESSSTVVKTDKEPESVDPGTKEESVNSPDPLAPLRICVTPEPFGGAASGDGGDEIHDSIGALDLSGSKGDSSTSDVSSPLSAGSCRSSASPVGSTSNKMGPHPYFMTPSAVYHHVQQQDPAQSMAVLEAAASATSINTINNKQCSLSKSAEDVKKPPMWDLFHQHIRPSTAHSSQQAQSLLDLLNPLLFRGNNNKKSKKTSSPGKQKFPPSSPNSA